MLQLGVCNMCARNTAPLPYVKHIRIEPCTRTYTSKYACVYTHVHARTRTYTHVPTRTHMYTCTLESSSTSNYPIVRFVHSVGRLLRVSIRIGNYTPFLHTPCWPTEFATKSFQSHPPPLVDLERHSYFAGSLPLVCRSLSNQPFHAR